MRSSLLFLTSPAIKKILNNKYRTVKGFSLIELVVVIAVLAVLIAIALPNFLGVQRDAKISSAKNTLTNIIKECAVKSSRGGPERMGSTNAADPNGSQIATAFTDLNGYSIKAWAANGQLDGGQIASGSSCMEASAQPDNPGELASFSIQYNGATGQLSKRCVAANEATYKEGCFVDPRLTGGSPARGVIGYW